MKLWRHHWIHFGAKPSRKSDETIDVLEKLSCDVTDMQLLKQLAQLIRVKHGLYWSHDTQTSQVAWHLPKAILIEFDC